MSSFLLSIFAFKQLRQKWCVLASFYACETVQLLQHETLDFISPHLCPPNSPVDYRVWRLMQECVYIVQDTCPRHQRLDAQKVTKCQSWSVEKGVVCMREGKKTSLCTPAKLKGCVVLFTGWFHRCIRLEHSDASLMHRWNQPVNKTTHPNQQFPEPTHYTTGCYRGKHVVSRHFHRSYVKAKYVKVKS